MTPDTQTRARARLMASARTSHSCPHSARGATVDTPDCGQHLRPHVERLVQDTVSDTAPRTHTGPHPRAVTPLRCPRTPPIQPSPTPQETVWVRLGLEEARDWDMSRRACRVKDYYP
jgi:hypothetical protein